MQLKQITAPLYQLENNLELAQARVIVAADIVARRLRANSVPARFSAGLSLLNQAQQADNAAYNLQLQWHALGAQRDAVPPQEIAKYSRLIFKKLRLSGDVYTAGFDGFYCPLCGVCYKKTELPYGKCLRHENAARPVNGESWYFGISKYRDSLEAHYQSNPSFLSPQLFFDEASQMCVSKLEDIVVVFPGETAQGKGQTACFWFEAFAGYLAARQNGLQESLQLVDAGGLRLHATVWPALLMALKLPLPEKIHFLPAMDGEIMPLAELAAVYGVDALRYFLIKGLPAGADGKLSAEALRKAYNTELANDLGGLLGRLTLLVDKYLDGELPTKTPGDAYPLVNSARSAAAQINSRMESLDLSGALFDIMAFLGVLNSELDNKKPRLLAADGDKADLKLVLFEFVWCLRMAAGWLEPFMPDTAADIHSHLGVRRSGEVFAGALPTPPLFPRK